MRKKISSILVGILLIFAGVFASACGDKYKNFEFEITYAFSENSENWYDANDGISLNYLYDKDNNEYVFDINGQKETVSKNDFKIYVKVEIKNVKSKHLDSVTVSAEGTSGLSFTSSTIKDGGTVSLPVVGLVNSQLKFYENKSGKSTKIDMSVYGKLTDISRNADITPAIVVGNSIDLNSIRDLIYYNKGGITTNQTGVDYEVVEFGSFASNTFAPVSSANNQQLKQYVSITNGKLKLNQKIRTISGESNFALTNANNVLKIKAISKYSPAEPTAENPEIAEDIYVYIVENNLNAPVITFAGTETNVNTTSNPGLDLYFNTEPEKYSDSNEYTKSTVEISDLNSIYQNSTIKTADERTLKFKVFAYIGNSIEPYEFGTAAPIRNLKIDQLENQYTISLLSQSVEKQVDVKFAYQIVCEDGINEYPVTFTEAKPSYATKVVVRKHILTSSILVNGENYESGDVINGVVYSTSSASYEGYKLQLGVDPIDQYNPQSVIIDGITNLNVTDDYGFKVNNSSAISHGKTLKIKFASDVYEKQTVTLSALRTPTYYNGKDFTSPNYVSVNLVLERQVTADALEFVEPVDANNFAEVSSINVAANKTSYLYIKAYHKGALKEETITLSSGGFGLNANGDKKVLLSEKISLSEAEAIKADEGYTIYKLAIPATNNVATSKLTVYAGEFGYGASKEITLNSVDLINNASTIQILPKDSSQVKSWDNTKFALAKGEDVSFNVVEKVSNEFVHKTIQSVTLTAVEKNNLGVSDEIKEKFGDAEVLSKTEFKNSNIFNIYGWNAKTRVFNVSVKYYDQIDVDSDGKNDIVSLLTSTIENVQFAIYNPITSISITVTNPKVAYVNKMFPEAATTQIIYNSYSGIGGEGPSQSVYFLNDGALEEKISVTSVQISVDKNLEHQNGVELSYLKGLTYDRIQNSTINNVNKVLNNVTNKNGTLKLQLTNITTLKDIKFIVTAKRFDKITKVVQDVTINFANVETATGFNITKGDLVEYSNENRELQLSFLGVEGDTVSKSFKATPVYKSAVPDASTLQFKDLEKFLYKYYYINGVQQFETDGNPKLIPITNFENSLKISIVDGEVVVNADKTIENIGGEYKLVIATKDSYNDIDGTYKTTYALTVRVSDGSSLDAAYIVKTSDEFLSINNDLSAHYVLGNNITLTEDILKHPIGYESENVTAFKGSLSGKLQTYTESGNVSGSSYNLTVKIKNKLNFTNPETGVINELFALFAILDENAKISNLNVYSEFSDELVTDAASNIGGIVAINRGTIEDVNVYLKTSSVNIQHATNFGVVAGVNDSTGVIKNCVVDLSGGLTINASAASNIGGVAGLNKGTISGKYTSKDDLNQIEFDVIANIKVNNIVDNIEYNIGGVAGQSTEKISNLIVGGQIIVNSEKPDASPAQLLTIKGHIGGIVGSTSANVEMVAAVGLDLVCDIMDNTKNQINIAGIAGYAANITEARYISVLANFGTLKTTGQIEGFTVAGIAHTVTGIVEHSTVESFIKTLEDSRTGAKSIFYAINGNKAYGLVKSGSVKNSFVSANIKATDAYLTSYYEGTNPTKEDSTYFIGKVDGNVYNKKSTYSVVINEGNSNAQISFGKQLSEFGASFVKTEWESNITISGSGFAIDENINIVKVSDYENVSFYFPYIVKNGKPLMILQPSSIGVAINKDYQIETEANVHIDKVEIKDDATTPTYTITESIIVDYFKNNYSNVNDANKHYLVNSLCDNCKNGTGDCLKGSDCGTCENCTIGSGECLNKIECHKGLIDLSILPANSTSGLTFELIANYTDIASIENNTYLVLTGVTYEKPIIIRAYSMFNPEAEAYFAIYSQSIFSELILKGSSVVKLEENKYTVNVYEGKNALISIDADNIIKGTSFESIFTNNSSYIKVKDVIENVADSGKIKINANNLKSITIAVDDNYDVTGKNESVIVKLNVYLDKSYFGEFSKFADDEIGLSLGTIELIVNLNNVATKLDIVGSDDFEIDSSSSLNFEAKLTTGFVSSRQSADLSPEVVDGVVVLDQGTASEKDSIRMSISSSSDELDRIKEIVGASSYAELFDFEVFETKEKEDEGYNYQISLSLKDKFNYRYVTKDIDLILNIWANSNENVQNSISVKIKPTTANTTRLANYAVESVNTLSSTKSELTSGNVETSIISPGGRGNIMLAYIEKSYANIDSIYISSSKLNVPEKGTVNLMFTQFVYNTDTHKFETLFNADVQNQTGDTRELQKVTTINNAGKTEYTGLLYIHVQLIKFVGVEDKITASLHVTSNGKTLPVVTKDLLTTFLPGASLSYNGIEISDGYLIQEATYENTAKIRLYGYQFNSNPTMIVDWELDKGSNYYYYIDNDNNKTVADEDENEKLEAYRNGFLYYYLDEDRIDENNKVIQTKGYYKANSEADLSLEDTPFYSITFYSITNKKLIFKDENNNGYRDSSEKLINVANYVSAYFVKDYTNIEYNSVDGSYTMEVKFNVAQDIPANFSLQASLKLITSDGQFENGLSDKIVFYPSKYVVTNISVKDTAGNKKMLAINSTSKLEFIFSTLRTDYDYSAEIYENSFVSKIANLAELFSYYNPTQVTFADDTAHPEFDIDKGQDSNGVKYISITGLSKFEKQITLSVWVDYELINGKYELTFSEKSGGAMKKYEYSFLLQIYPAAGEENATPIYTANDMFDSEGNCRLAENGHYILMADITLDLVKPIDYAIGSLDGNNHIIKIKNFVIDKSKTEYGLFAQIGTYTEKVVHEDGSETVVGTKKTILKNVIVDYSEFNAENGGKLEFTNNQIKSIKFGGLVATNNGALIYNCDVINSNVASDKVINIIVDDNASVTFGGLVGTNSGVITNSRVGRREFKDIDARANTQQNLEFAGLTFTLGSATASGFNSVAGGFVGENSGTISSSYFANSSLINYSNSKDENITAGFAGKNASTGTIVYSYVKAKETTINPSVPYATGARIEGKSNGIVAGFVYENAGIINDCYANTELYTQSTYMAGFVYNNMSSGKVSESYAACTMNSSLLGKDQDNAEQPFVGKDNKDNYLDEGTMSNNYYLISSDGSGDVGSTSAQALNATNFSNANNLQGFVFVQSNVTAERQQGVWSHIDIKGNSVILPELMNANLIAHSAKYLYSGNGIDEKFTYTNADSYVEGSVNNPFIIRNVQEYNSILTGNRTNMSDEVAKSGYIRLIDSIDFGEDQDAIKTRVKYTLGDKNRSNITSFEGNGLSINGIYFDVSEPGIREIGLFANINYAYVKNLNLNFVTPKSGGQYSTTSVKYSGGLAGIITNSAIINVKLNGKDVALTGENYVGGLAGMVNGDSLLYGITSNLSVSASSNSTALYYNKKDFVDLGNNESTYNTYIANLSYAGGLAGVIDVEKRTNTTYNIAYIDIHGDEMFTKTSDNGMQLANIEGQYAGGIAGFASKNSSGLKLKYHMGATDRINGSVAAGGLFGVSMGKITASQVTAVEDTQYNHDAEFGKYVLDIDNKTLDSKLVGNLQLIESNNHAGGLIGIGLNAGINSSYSKATFKQGKVIGGLIGTSIASNVNYSYAVPFVNLTDITKNVGGLFGESYTIEKDKNYTGDSLSNHKELVKLYLNRDSTSSRETFTDIQFTFSTLLVDKTSLDNKNVTSEASSAIKLGYIVPNSTDEAYASSLRSGGSSTFSGVYEGVLDSYEYTAEDSTIIEDPIYDIGEKAKNSDLKVMYDLTHTKQETTFSEIFSSWKAISYWTLKHEKYFPLLTSEGVENYIEINDAEDMKMIASNPDGKYKIVEDINMSSFPTAGNWVFSEPFTGELVGEIDSDSNTRKKIYGITLSPNMVESSGFFKATSGAIISDLEFVWSDGGNGAINPTAASLTSVAGLSCSDSPYIDGEKSECSEFNNIEVSVSGGGYLLKYPRNASGDPNVDSAKSITTFGGLVASTENSIITNCDFVGKAEVKLSGDKVYFGGLVGSSKESSDQNVKDSSMSIMNSVVGANGEDTTKTTTEFEITLDSKTIVQEANIGGLAGHVSDTSVLSTSVGGVNNVESRYTTIPMTINIDSEIADGSSQQIGGLVGYSDKSAIDSSDVDTNIKVVGGKSDKNIKTTVAGLNATFADGTGNMDVLNTNAKAHIDVAELKTKGMLIVAGGIGSLSSTGTIDVLKQCLFTGSIIGEKVDPTDANNVLTTVAGNIIAGGAIGSVEDGVKVSETMTTVDITIGTLIDQPHEIKAGGFVGKIENDSLTLNKVVSTGKLVPFCGAKASAIHLGGMIGSVEDNSTANIYNSYTLTSIISDAINGQALNKTHSDALVGFVGNNGLVNTKHVKKDESLSLNVYYSTDFALTTNDKNYGNNLSAYDLVYSDNQVWKNKFIEDCEEDSTWKFIQGTTEGRLPYLKAIEDNLKKYQVLNLEDGKHDYILGSSLRPILIGEDVDFDNYTTFNYYILEVNVKLSNALNGVLIGSEQIFNHDVGTGFVDTVNKHSAISNIHLNLGLDSEITLNGNVGFVANTNNGLIFNSSVQGQEITIKNGDTLGLITAINNGTVAYSYSSAEIENVDIEMSGLVYTNDGVINSCYFTGYINNTKISAGILAAISSDDENSSDAKNSYVYNTYMAGVVESIQSGHTSFYAGDASELIGRNNYIDQFANIEVGVKVTVEEEIAGNKIDVSVLESVTTAKLMTKINLEGSWYDIVKEDTDGNVDVENVEIDVASDSFGKNYGYPIYKFNKKYSSNGTDLYCSDLDYSLITGTGETQETSVAEMYAALTDTSNLANNKEYNDSYKIPHLGILSTIDGLQDKNRNYVVIYDIDGLMINWSGVGSSAKESAHGFVGTGAFNGVFITNKYLNNSSSKSGDTVTKNLCAIQGLNNTGIFNEIGVAYIADIALGSFGKEIAANSSLGIEASAGLTDSGAIGKTVVNDTTGEVVDKSSVSDNTRVMVYNVQFLKDSIILGNNVAGLFGSINSIVRIKHFNTVDESDMPNLVLEGAGTAGLITSSLGDNSTSATVHLDKAGEDITTNKLAPVFKGFETAGGLIGKINNGSLYGNDNTLILGKVTTTETVDSFGGIVGSVSTTTTTNSIVEKVKLEFNTDAVIPANSFGGFVAQVNGEIKFSGCTLSADKLKINSENSGNRAMLIAEITKTTGDTSVTGKATIENFNLTSNSELTFNGGENDSSIGGVVGRQNGDLTLSYVSGSTLELNTEKTPNMGGIIGVYDGGNITIFEYVPSGDGSQGGAGTMSDGGSSGAAITLKGCQNVGGFIGKANAFPVIHDPDGTDTKIKPIDFLVADNAYAKIVIKEYSSNDTITTSLLNFGGIFGVLKASNTKVVNTTGGATTSANGGEGYVTIENKNTFEFENLDKKSEEKVMNIGGVIGLFEPDNDNIKTSTLGDLTNNVTLDFTTAQGYKFTNVGGVVGKFKGAGISDAENRGAIKAEGFNNSAISSSEGSKDKKPYAVLLNVGGVVGLVDSQGEDQPNNTKLTNLINTVDVQGYQNVGGLVGYAIKADIQGSISIDDNKSLAIDNGKIVEAGTDKEVNIAESVQANINIIGVINVGGVVGYVQDSTITKIQTAANVFGNANVGGLIGLSNENKLTNNVVGIAQKSDEVQTTSSTPSNDNRVVVKAIYYNAYFENNGNMEYITYIPTSVGGLIGTSKETEIAGNIVNNIDILSTKEGEETGQPNEKSKGMISTIQNHMAEIGLGSGSSGLDAFTSQNELYVLGSEGNSKVIVKFSDVESGFGGFIGTLDNTEGILVDGKQSTEGDGATSQDTGSTEIKRQSSYMNGITINVPLGINVGTYFGVYQHDNEFFNVPVLYGDITVDGAYHIGGVAGSVNGDTIGLGLQTFGSDNLPGSFRITLQKDGMGMYVGGLFGKMSSKEAYLEIINENIKINTKSSYYMGGLVGKLQVAAGNTFSGRVATNAQKQLKITTSDIDKIESAQNFGGLVGMLKCVGGGTYSVNGEHYYPFTVNTIENSNYAEGKSQFDTELSEDNVNLYAQANYINQDSFNISATKGSFYEDVSKNPLNPDSWGWAKEYTGFKQMQRCIPQSGTWDSIAVVYNAEWITEVGTVGNLQLTTGTLCNQNCGTEHTHTFIRTDGDDNYFYRKNGDPDPVYLDDQHIVYTIYKKNQDVEMLYSAIGIAEIAQIAGENVNDANTDTSWYTNNNYDGFDHVEIKDDKGNIIGYKDDVNTIAEYYYVRNMNEHYRLMGYYQTMNDESDVSKGYTKNIYRYNSADDDEHKGAPRGIHSLNLNDLLYFNWNGNIEQVICEDVSGDSVVQNKRNEVKLYYYKSKNNKFYDFKVIYANDTLVDSGFNKTFNIDKNNVPNSGSVFEIYGLNPSLYEDQTTIPPNFWNKYGKFILILGEILLSAIGAGIIGHAAKSIRAFRAAAKLVNGGHKAYMATKGATIAAKNIVWNAAKETVKKGIKGIIKTSAKWLFRVGLAAAATAVMINNFDQMFQNNAAVSRNLYYETKNQNFGLLTSTTTTEIRYENNTMVGSLGSMVTKVENETEYKFKFYSNSRPSDYYKNYYIIPKDSFETNKDILTQGLTGGLPYGADGITAKSNCLYSFDYSYSTTEGVKTVTAELKYIYHEGAYYCNVNSLKIGLYRTQELSDPSIVAETDAQVYYGTDGIAYVLGDYKCSVSGCTNLNCSHDKAYSFSKHGGLNHVDPNGDGTYSLNGNNNIKGEQEVDVEFVGVSQSAYDIVTSKPGVVEGYDYLKNAYYTTKGTATNDKNYIKYATYEYWTEYYADGSTIKLSDYTLGVDYIEAYYTLVETDNDYGDWYYDESTSNYKSISSYIPDSDVNGDGELNSLDFIGNRYTLTQNQKVVLKISEMVDGVEDIDEGAKTSRSLGDLTDTELKDVSVALKTYPTCFKNPYVIKPSGDYKDGNFYIAKTASQSASEPIFKFKVKYYYFEGGYMLWQDFGESLPSIKDTTYLEKQSDGTTKTITLNELMENSVYRKMDTEVMNDGNLGAIYLFTETASEEPESFPLYKGVPDGPPLITLSGNIAVGLNTDYSSYYISSVKTYQDSISETSDKLEQDSYRSMIDSKRVDVNYIVYDGEVWVKDDSYMLDEKGFVNKTYIYNDVPDNEVYFVHGRYLSYNSNNTDGYKGVYTMFRYSENLYFKEKTREWIWKIGDVDYHLIPIKANRSRPNNNVNSTYLVESCKVVLGGGVTLNYTGSSKDPTSGTIAIE